MTQSPPRDPHAPQPSVSMALRAGTQRLTQAGISGAPRDARVLMAHVLEIGIDRLTLVGSDPISPEQDQGFQACLDRRIAREPVSHIVGQRMFYGREFTVSGDVLDPRPETETLIVEALRRPFASVLDLGTGSGAILLTLLAENPLAKGLGTDLSNAALLVAEDNAARLNLAKSARFALSDWFDKIEGRFDLIVSNPPYIAHDEMAGLAPELSYEPRMALTDEADGLTAYRAIARGVLGHLAPRGRLLVEIGPTQGAAVADLFMSAGLKGVRVLQDLDGRDRVVYGQKPNAHPRNHQILEKS